MDWLIAIGCLICWGLVILFKGWLITKFMDLIF